MASPSASMSALFEDIRYLKLILLLVKGGTLSAKKLIQKCSTTGKKCIDDFLKDNEGKLNCALKKKIICKAQINILFPGPSTSTDLECWDISLLSYILLNVFDDKVESYEKVAITALRNKRNELLGHAASTIMSEVQFSRASNRLTMVICQLTRRLTIVEQDEINDTIDDILAIQDFHLAKQQLQSFEVSDEFVKNVISKMSKSFDQKLGDLGKRVDDLEVFKNKAKPLLDMMARINMEGSSQDVREKAQEKFFSVALRCVSDKQDQNNEQDQDDDDEVLTAIKHLFSDMIHQGVDIVKVEEGSILVTFRCPTISALKNISKYIFDRMYEKRLIELENALSEYVKSPIKLNISIVLETLHSALMQIEKDANNKSIVLTLKCRGSEGVKSAIDCFGNGSSSNALNKISEALSRYVGQKVELHTTIGVDKLENDITELEQQLILGDQNIVHDLQRHMETSSELLHDETAATESSPRFKHIEVPMVHTTFTKPSSTYSSQKSPQISIDRHPATKYRQKAFADTHNLPTGLAIDIETCEEHTKDHGLANYVIQTRSWSEHANLYSDCESVLAFPNKDTFDSKSFSAEDSTEEKKVLHQKQLYTLRRQGDIMFLSDPLVGTCGGDMYGHSDDQTDDSDDSKKKGLTGQGQKRRNKTQSKWIIDPAAWKTCINSHNTHTLVYLLKEKKLPDNDLLNEACNVFEPNFIRLICDEICKYIVQKSSHIIYVYPANMVAKTTNESDACTITFVVVLGEEVDLGHDFNFHIKNINDPAPLENFQINILEREKKYVFGNETDSNIARLTKCIQKHSTSLREKHTNVCRISLSGFKSIQFGKVGGSMTQIDCITLYVYAKGLIPLGENLLPATLDVDGCQVLVDVREGFVEAYVGKQGPYDTLKNLRMGCSIGVEPRTNGEALNGTLGGFFKMGGADFCMSSAHVVLSANEIRLLEMQETPLLERIDLGKHVYQPHDNYLMPFGRSRTAVYKEGGNGATGVDVVSILIQNRNPNTGEFPMSDRGQDSDKEYSHGQVYNREEIRNALKSDAYRCFYKYGCGTGWTTGRFRSGCATFCAPHPVQDGNTDFQICLHNQFELYGDTDKDFAGKSDSGALVFMEDKGELVAVGMVVAGMAGEVCFVTPLDEIFKALKLDPISLKTFTTGGNRSHSNEPDEVSVNAEITELKCDMSNVKTDVEDIKFKMRDMERDRKREMHDMKTDIKDVQYSVNKLADIVEGSMEGIMRLLQNMSNPQNS